MGFWNDLRYGARSFRNTPGFAATAIVTLAFGMGLTTSTFSVADGLLWKPLPKVDLTPLAVVYRQIPNDPDGFASVSPADMRDIRSRNRSFRAMSYWTGGLANIVGTGGEAERVNQYLVAPNFFRVVGVAPAVGRDFEEGEDTEGRDRVVILSDSLWQRRFAGDRSVVGHTIRMDDENFTVIGVMPPKFEFPKTAELWTPYAMTPAERVSRDRSNLMGVGLLQPGVKAAQANQEIRAISGQLAGEYPQTNKNRKFIARDARDFLTGTYTRQYMLMMFASALFVLLIACVNVANLQFARAFGRTREMALRTALGAGRGRLIGQLLTESVLLSVIGAVLGLLVARWSLDMILAGMPADVERYVPGWKEIHLDMRAMLFTFGAAMLSGILAGLAPAWHASRPHLAEALKEGGRGSSEGRTKHRLRGILVGAEVALAVVLLVGASLMVRSFYAQVQSGQMYQPSTLLTFRLAITENKYKDKVQQVAYYTQVLDRAGAVPGVLSASGVYALPYASHSTWRMFDIEGLKTEPGDQPEAQFQASSANYLAAMHIPLLAGRTFDSRDGAGTPYVAVISQRFAKRWWPRESPVGRRIRAQVAKGESAWTTIVGVVADTPQTIFQREPRAMVFVPYQQVPYTWMDIAVRTSGDPDKVTQAVLTAVRSVDPEQPIASVFPMDTLMRHEATGLIYVAVMMGVYGLLALALSMVGVYGVMAYMVGEQRHEIGIRMALGSPRRRVMGMLFRRGLITTGTGLAVGLVAAYFMARVLASLIWGVDATDPATFIAIPLALLGAAALAIYLPARTAIRIDPMVALRSE